MRLRWKPMGERLQKELSKLVNYSEVQYQNDMAIIRKEVYSNRSWLIWWNYKSGVASFFNPIPYGIIKQLND